MSQVTAMVVVVAAVAAAAAAAAAAADLFCSVQAITNAFLATYGLDPSIALPLPCVLSQSLFHYCEETP